MSVKSQLTGTVVSDKMDKTVVVSVERQVRHDVYGKTQRKTSKFVAHNENNEAKMVTLRRDLARIKTILREKDTRR